MNDVNLHFLFLEPFYGGSHKAFADGLIAHCRHEIELRHLPARFWKWRMRGAALHFLDKIEALTSYHGVIMSDLMSAADFKALAGHRCPPILVYFHENQLAYPLSPGEKMDYQFGFTDITSALAADRLLFNSAAHRDMMVEQLPDFLNRMPDYRPGWVIEAIKAKAGVCYPGCDFPANFRSGAPDPGGPPMILWNHRWEHDKDPDTFFDAMAQLIDRGIEFKIVVLGQQFAERPPSFDTARQRFGDRIVQFGYAASRRHYFDWLQQADLVISTARQENFGMSIVEAIRCGCLPLVPNRLSYPEVIAERFHGTCIYHSFEDLTDKLAHALLNLRSYDRIRAELALDMERFAWPNCIPAFERQLEALAASRRPGPKQDDLRGAYR